MQAAARDRSDSGSEASSNVFTPRNDCADLICLDSSPKLTNAEGNRRFLLTFYKKENTQGLLYIRLECLLG